jgi:hypothetical protein
MRLVSRAPGAVVPTIWISDSEESDDHTNPSIRVQLIPAPADDARISREAGN